ncbi:MAG TPA: hypothetical protein VFM99_11330 [Chitinophagales bacterium]|nr:hypothetical protein [Chitinophagales bacterium]
MKYLFTILLTYCSLVLTAQNNLQLTFEFGHGTSSWQYSKVQMAETNQTGDTLNLYDLDIHANGPTIIGNINLGYNFEKLTIGLGFSAQHFFINELISESIYLEESNIYIPTTFSSYNDPQPTHFKFYPFVEYAFMRENNLELFALLSGGTFYTHSVAANSNEGFHWFVNLSGGLNYSLNKSIDFSISPTFDYSRLNFAAFDDTERKAPYLNIYSFYTSFGLTYKFID